MVVTSKLRTHKVMEAAIRELMGAGTPPRFKFGDTYASIEFPDGYTVPAQATLEAKYNELLALENDIQTTVLEGDLEVGTSNLFVDTQTGLVGIGTDSPSGELHVRGENMYLQSALVSNCTWRIMPQTGNSTKLFRIYDQDNSADRLVINASGNVGIGTVSPSHKLNVRATSGDAEVHIQAQGNDGGDAILYFNGANANQRKCAIISSNVAPNSWCKQDLYFCHNTDSNSDDVTIADSKMVITNNGNVGIGTASPAYKLDVHGTSNVGALTATSVSQAGAPVTVRWDYSNSTAFPQNPVSAKYYKVARLGTTTESSCAGRLRISGTIGGFTTVTTSLIDCYVSSRGVLEYGGSMIGMGTSFATTPCDILVYKQTNNTYDVYLKTDNYFTFDLTISGATLNTYLTKVVYPCPTTDTSVSTPVGTLEGSVVDACDFVLTDSGNVGIGAVSPSYKLDVDGTIYASGDVIMFSDERKKTHIETIPNALEKVLQLRGVTFNKLDDDNRRHSGVIAQEVEKVLPEVVYTAEDDTKSVAYGNMIGLLIEAIKELAESRT